MNDWLNLQTLVPLIFGALIIGVVLKVYYRQQQLNFGGIALAVLGFILVGLGYWQHIEVSGTKDTLTISVDTKKKIDELVNVDEQIGQLTEQFLRACQNELGSASRSISGTIESENSFWVKRSTASTEPISLVRPDLIVPIQRSINPPMRNDYVQFGIRKVGRSSAVMSEKDIDSDPGEKSQGNPVESIKESPIDERKPDYLEARKRLEKLLRRRNIVVKELKQQGFGVSNE